MVNESPSIPPATPESAAGNPPSFGWLRWAIRLTGVLLMFAGTIYLGLVAASLLLGKGLRGSPIDALYVIIVSLVTLGLVIFVLRTGLRMLHTIDRCTISHFSLAFALVYTPILIQILPASSWFPHFPAAIYLLRLLYFGLAYWLLKQILLRLLLPDKKAGQLL